MGNCLRHGSSDTAWAGEDWDCSVGESSFNGKCSKVAINGGSEKLRLLGEQVRDQIRSDSDFDSNNDHRSRDQVKIKISKRELEELMGVHGVPVNQLISYLMINGQDRPDHYAPDYGHLYHQRSWRPALRTIPEVN